MRIWWGHLDSAFPLQNGLWRVYIKLINVSGGGAREGGELVYWPYDLEWKTLEPSFLLTENTCWMSWNDQKPGFSHNALGQPQTPQQSSQFDYVLLQTLKHEPT